MTDSAKSSRSAPIPGRDPSVPLSCNKHLLKWIQKIFALTQPDAVHWVDGSQEEYDALCKQMVKGGTFVKLNEELWPGCYYARSDPGDVARVEDRTFICSLSKDGAGPTNNWANPFEMRRKLKELFLRQFYFKNWSTLLESTTSTPVLIFSGFLPFAMSLRTSMLLIPMASGL